MAGSFFNFAELEILDHAFGKGAWTSPTIYIGLSTSTPAEDATGITEPSGNNYSQLTTSAIANATKKLTATASSTLATVLTRPRLTRRVTASANGTLTGNSIATRVFRVIANGNGVLTTNVTVIRIFRTLASAGSTLTSSADGKLTLKVAATGQSTLSPIVNIIRTIQSTATGAAILIGSVTGIIPSKYVHVHLIPTTQEPRTTIQNQEPGLNSTTRDPHTLTDTI